MNKILSFSEFKTLAENNPTEAENNLKSCEYEYSVLGDYELFESTLNEAIDNHKKAAYENELLSRFLNRKSTYKLSYNDDDWF